MRRLQCVVGWLAVCAAAAGCLDAAYSCTEGVVNASVCTSAEPVQGYPLEFSALACACGTSTTSCTASSSDGGLFVEVQGRTCTKTREGLIPAAESDGCATVRATCTVDSVSFGTYRLFVNGAERGTLEVALPRDGGVGGPQAGACWRNGTQCP